MRWLKNLFSLAETLPTPADPAAPLEAGRPPAPALEAGWASHLRVSESGPVAIAVDLGLEPRAPLADHPRLVRVRCALRAPRPDGQPEPAEAEALVRVEDLLAAALAPAGAVYAGRVTLAGFREHLFYLPGGAEVTAALEGLRAQLAGYELTQSGEDDPAWEAYRVELFPTPRAHRWILDQRAVTALLRRGDRVADARAIDHQACFPSAAAREAFVAEAAGQGFEAVARRDDGPPPNGFGADLRRTDPATLQHLHGVTWGLCELAARHGGAYDGWEAEPAAAGGAQG